MNELELTITSKIKDNIEYFMFVAKLNSNELKIFHHETTMQSNLPSFRGILLENFLNIKFSHFVLTNYKPLNDIKDIDSLREKYPIDKARLLMTYRMKMGLNYYISILKTSIQKLKSMDRTSIRLHTELQDFSIENIVELEKYLDLHKYIDYEKIEEEYPEYFI